MSPSMAVALVAVVVAATGGAYAASSTSSKTIAACVRHSGGAVYVAKKCKRHDKRLTWNTTGPRGSTGAAGSQGVQGSQGPPGTPDPSQFYDKATSDARFVQGGGTIIPVHQISIANSHKGTIVDVPGVGTLSAQSCSLGTTDFRFLNTTGSNEVAMMTNLLQGVNDTLATSKTLVPTGFVNDNTNSAPDIEHVSVAIGTTGVADFLITQTRDTSVPADCLYWGEVYVG